MGSFSQFNSPLLSLFITTLLSLHSLSISSPETTHLHFYLHDTLSGPHPSAVRVTDPNSTLSLSFGDIVVFDDPLTKQPNLNSTIIGRAQGYYAHISKEDFTLMMVMNLIFLEGKFNGSSLQVIGKNSILEKVREFPILGGSGLFRGSRGWVLDKTYSVDPNTGDGIFEFNVFIIR
ncbi:hypothetical protein LUZ60_011195 [Juncus effusus]|nr:hypothetical protein LUZ60_011195 [Juncus effusus]